MKKTPKDSDWVICLGGGASQVPLIKAAIELGYKVLVIDRNPHSEGFFWATETLVVSIYDADSIIDKVKFRHFCGVLCRCTGEALITSAKISEYFGLSGLSEELVCISTSKSTLRQFCEVNQVNMPRGFKSAADFDAARFSGPTKHELLSPTLHW